MAIGGGYVRYNPNPNIKLGAWMTGTTMAWYTMPGWEVNYLWGRADVGEMNPIALGDAFHEYVVSSMTQAAIMKFLEDKKDQVVKIAKSAGRGRDVHDSFHALMDGVEVQTSGLQFSHLSATFAEAEVPPTTYMRQAIMSTGIGFVGSWDNGLFGNYKNLYNVVDGLGSLVGLSPTEKLLEHSGSKRHKIMLMLKLGGGHSTYGLNWADVPLVNGKTCFGMIADKLRNTKIGKFTPSGAWDTAKKKVHKSSFLSSMRDANRTLGRFI